MIKNKRELWVTNISRQKDISLGDLKLTIRRGESRNLLDSKHYNYTEEQLETSVKSGSIYQKRAFIKVRDVAPVVAVPPGKYTVGLTERYMPTLRSPVRIVEKDFPDIDSIFEDQEDLKFALESADMAADDRKPATLIVDKKLSGDKK